MCVAKLVCIPRSRSTERTSRSREQIAGERGIRVGEATLEELDRIWDEVKEENAR